MSSYRDDLGAALARVRSLEDDNSRLRRVRIPLRPVLAVLATIGAAVAALWMVRLAAGSVTDDCGETRWLDGSGRFLGAIDGRRPRYLFERDRADASCLEVRFDRPLDGARVDVTARDEVGRAFPVWRGRRVRGDRLRVQMDAGAPSHVEVVVHRHLRAPAVVRHWRFGAAARNAKERT